MMVTLLLAMVGSAALFKLIGGAVIVLAGLAFLRRALSRTFRQGDAGGLYGLALLWVPGLIAVALSVVSIVVVTANQPGNLAYSLAVVMFGCETAILVMDGLDADGLASSFMGVR